LLPFVKINAKATIYKTTEIQLPTNGKITHAEATINKTAMTLLIFLNATAVIILFTCETTNAKQTQ
jgi:hypothetical protein